MKSILAHSALALVLALLLGWPALATLLAMRGESPVQTGGGLIAPLALESDAAGVPRPLRLAATSVVVVLGTLAIALPLGVTLAFLLFRTDLWGRRVGIALAALLAFVPLPLVATAWLGALGNAGRTQALGLGPILTGRWGAAFIQAMAALPWVVLLGGVGLRSVNPELEEAALLDLPALRVVVQVTLRRSAALLAGAVLAVAVVTAGDMTVTDLLQVRTYAEEAYVQYSLGHGPEAASVTLLPLLVLGTLVALLTWGLLGADRARLATAVGQSKVWRLGGWRVKLGLVAAAPRGPGRRVAVLQPDLVGRASRWRGHVGAGAPLVDRRLRRHAPRRARRSHWTADVQLDLVGARRIGNSRAGLGPGLGQPDSGHLAWRRRRQRRAHPGHARTGRWDGAEACLHPGTGARLATLDCHGGRGANLTVCLAGALAGPEDHSPGMARRRGGRRASESGDRSDGSRFLQLVTHSWPPGASPSSSPWASSPRRTWSRHPGRCR